MSEPRKDPLATFSEPRYSVTDLQRAYAEGAAEARRELLAKVEAERQGHLDEVRRVYENREGHPLGRHRCTDCVRFDRLLDTSR